MERTNRKKGRKENDRKEEAARNIRKTAVNEVGGNQERKN